MCLAQGHNAVTLLRLKPKAIGGGGGGGGEGVGGVGITLVKNKLISGCLKIGSIQKTSY